MWLLLVLGPLFFFQRSLHRGLQVLLLLITRRLDISLAVFSLLLLPGVALHELSHYGMARLLGVRTGRFSITPQTMPDGRLKLGFVETAAVDPLRDALIGAAPLITGGAFVAYTGLYRLGLLSFWAALQSAPPHIWLASLGQLPQQPDFWVWFYLAFAVSSAMLPSTSDRRAWLPVAGVLGGLLLLALLLGAGSWMLERLAPTFNQGMRSIAIVLGISALLHLTLLPPVWLLQILVSRLTGLRVSRG
jgi:hypothetical protein